MISSKLSNRLIFIFSLLGLGVSIFLYYEYSLAGSVVCPIGGGCDIVRDSVYSHFLGISIPVLGIIFYSFMAALAVFRLSTLQLIAAAFGVGFGVYLTFLEVFVIGAVCFWCVLSFIISLLILLSAFLERLKKDEHGN